jgi:hypothetical protein
MSKLDKIVAEIVKHLEARDFSAELALVAIAEAIRQHTKGVVTDQVIFLLDSDFQDLLNPCDGLEDKLNRAKNAVIDYVEEKRKPRKFPVKKWVPKEEYIAALKKQRLE